MSCPNAPTARTPAAAGAGCAGSGLVVHRSQRIPCPHCWRAAGHPWLSMWQVAALRGWLLCRDELLSGIDANGQVSTDTVEPARLMDYWAVEVFLRGVDDETRDLWAGWIDDRKAVLA